MAQQWFAPIVAAGGTNVCSQLFTTKDNKPNVSGQIVGHFLVTKRGSFSFPSLMQCTDSGGVGGCKIVQYDQWCFVFCVGAGRVTKGVFKLGGKLSNGCFETAGIVEGCDSLMHGKQSCCGLENAGNGVVVAKQCERERLVLVQ